MQQHVFNSLIFLATAAKAVRREKTVCETPFYVEVAVTYTGVVSENGK
jgi:DNA topoisomerase VI subunit B